MTTNFLCELIEKNTRVILPDFGAFLIKDDGTGVFKPENITFSPFLRYNDGLVEDMLAQAKGITKDDARKREADFIDSIKSELDTKKAFPLNEYGFLSLDSRGSIIFKYGKPEKIAKTEPAKAESPKPIKKATEKVTVKPEVKPEKEPEKIEKFSDADLLEIKENEKIEQVQQSAEVELPKNVEQKADIEIETPSTTKSATTKQKQEIKPITQSVKQQSKPIQPSKESSGVGKAIFIGVLIAIAVIAVAVGWFLLNGEYSNIKKEKVTEIALPTKPTQTESIKEKQESEDEQKGKFDEEYEKLSREMDKSPDSDKRYIEPKATPSTEVKTETPTTDNSIIPAFPSEGTFHLVVGSFRNLEYAEKFSNDLKSSGYSSRVIEQSSGMYAVTLGSFSTQSDALDAMDKVKSQHPNVWLLRH